MTRNETLTHATTWMNLENTQRSQRSQSQRPHYSMSHLYEMFKIGKSIETD